MTTRKQRNRAASASFEADRRSVLLGASAATVAALASFKKAHGLDDAAPAGSYPAGSFRAEKAHENVLRRPHVHEGKGVVDVRFFFQPEEFAKPAILLMYTLPPGASEGVHTHRPGDRKMGSFDEFYYIISGSGEMEIAGEKVPVIAGDHVFTPNGVAHGIENTSANGDLKVYLIAMKRA